MPDIGDCVLCGARGVELHREDALPRWVVAILDARPGIWSTKGDVETRIADRFLLDTCGPCNAAMNVLYENPPEARRILTPLIVGHPVRLTGRQQRFVADWLVKTSLLMRACVPADFKPALVRYFHANGFRLPGAQVWIAKYEPFMAQTPYAPAEKGSPPQPMRPRIPPREPEHRRAVPIGHPPAALPYVLSGGPLVYVGVTAIGALAVHVSFGARDVPVIFYRALDQLMFRLPGRATVSWHDLPTVTADIWADIRESIVISGSM